MYWSICSLKCNGGLSKAGNQIAWGGWIEIRYKRTVCKVIDRVCAEYQYCDRSVQKRAGIAKKVLGTSKNTAWYARWEQVLSTSCDSPLSRRALLPVRAMQMISGNGNFACKPTYGMGANLVAHTLGEIFKDIGWFLLYIFSLVLQKRFFEDRMPRCTYLHSVMLANVTAYVICCRWKIQCTIVLETIVQCGFIAYTFDSAPEWWNW